MVIPSRMDTGSTNRPVSVESSVINILYIHYSLSFYVNSNGMAVNGDKCGIHKFFPGHNSYIMWSQCKCSIHKLCFKLASIKSVPFFVWYANVCLHIHRTIVSPNSSSGPWMWLQNQCTRSNSMFFKIKSSQDPEVAWAWLHPFSIACKHSRPHWRAMRTCCPATQKTWVACICLLTDHSVTVHYVHCIIGSGLKSFILVMHTVTLTVSYICVLCMHCASTWYNHQWSIVHYGNQKKKNIVIHFGRAKLLHSVVTVHSLWIKT